MLKVTKWETLDGKLHATQKDAARHADRLYGEMLSSLAHKLVKCEKYAQMSEALHGMMLAGDFARLRELWQDIELTKDEDEEWEES